MCADCWSLLSTELRARVLAGYIEPGEPWVRVTNDYIAALGESSAFVERARADRPRATPAQPSLF